MKKILFLLSIMLVVGGVSVWAEDVIWGSMYGQGNFRIGADVDIEGSSAGYQLALSPEAEYLFFKPVIGQTAFLDIGAAVRGRFGLGTTFSAGVGILGTIHIGFRGLDIPINEYADKVDIYAEVGGKFDFITPQTIPAWGFAVKSGANYFLSDSFAVGLHYSNWGGFSGGGVTASLKLGKTPEVKGISIEMRDEIGSLAVQPYLLQFYTLLYSAHFAGGFYHDSFIEGQAAVHRVSTIDSSGTDSYTIEQGFLKKLDGNMMLWSLKYVDDDVFYYEYVTDADYSIKTVYFESEDDGILELNADDDMYPESAYMAWEDSNMEGRPGVEITVEAGRFDTTEYVYVEENGVDVKWWTAEDVPGKLVSFKMEDDSDIITSELIDTTARNKPKLYK